MRTFKQPAETFGPYDPGAPRVAPDVSTPARAAAVRIEDEIRRDSLETGVFIAADGQEIMRRRGAPDRVSFPEADLLGMRGSTFTHNHPGDASFSLADYEAAVFTAVAELRAVSPSFRHMLRPAAHVPTVDDLRSFAVEQQSSISAKVAALAKIDAIPAQSMGVELQHQFWVEAARRFGFTYTREKS
jgi:hypothetical protein